MKHETKANIKDFYPIIQSPAKRMKKRTAEETGRPSPQQYASMPRIPVTVVLDNIRSLNNVGSFFRTADAFGVEKIVLCGITGRPPSRDIHKTALGAELTVNWEYAPEAASAVRALRGAGYVAVAVEQTDGSVMLDRFSPDPGTKYALVFGNEVEGVSDSTLEECDLALEIPQAGTKHSLNVAVSGGAVLWSFFCALAKTVYL